MAGYGFWQGGLVPDMPWLLAGCAQPAVKEASRFEASHGGQAKTRVRTLNSACQPSSLTVRTKQSTMPLYAIGPPPPSAACSADAPCQPDPCQSHHYTRASTLLPPYAVHMPQEHTECIWLMWVWRESVRGLFGARTAKLSATHRSRVVRARGSGQGRGGGCADSIQDCVDHGGSLRKLPVPRPTRNLRWGPHNELSLLHYGPDTCSAALAENLSCKRQASSP